MRQGEREADVIGMELMARAGYDPQSAIEFWAKALRERSSAANTPEWLSTHPTTERRVEGLRRILSQILPVYEHVQLKER
jgi:predicted Zn-dependent protease